MKLNINWKELGIQLLKAIWPVIAGALTGATVVTATGCTSMATQPRGQTTEIILCVMRFDCVINQLVSSALNWEASGIVFRAEWEGSTRRGRRGGFIETALPQIGIPEAIRAFRT